MKNQSLENKYHCPSCERKEFTKPVGKSKTLFRCHNHQREWDNRKSTYIKSPTLKLINGSLHGDPLGGIVFGPSETGYTFSDGGEL